MSGTYIVLVTVHNIVRVPKEVAALTTPGIRFRVAANAIGNDGAATAQLSKTCPEVSATFEPRDLQQIQQNHFEVKLDGTSGSGRGSLEWTSSTPSIDVLISVKEEIGSDSGRTIAAANTFTLDLLDIIERRKLRTLIVGTSMGYVGVSFAVAPSDSAGYRKRLEAFLREYNQSGLRLVANVVASVSELDTFTKVSKKYNLVDYKKRVQRFFATYGADHMSQCDVILKQWENREEELMRNLILDNGPELCDVDLKLRLSAYAKKYKLTDFDVGQLVRQHASNPQPFFDELIEKHGPEPDPRLYLFGPTFYGEKAPESPRRTPSTKRSANNNINNSSSYGAPPPPASSNYNSASGALQTSVSSSFGPLVDEEDTTTSAGKRSASSYNLPPADGDTAAAMRAAASGTYASSAALRNTVTFHEPDAPAVSAGSGGAPRGLPSSHAIFRPRDATPPPANAPSNATTATAAPLNAVELWSTLVEDLRSASIPSAELHYLNEASFLSLLGELGYGVTAKQLLVAEWQRRIQATLRMEQLTHGDSLFEAAKRDVITISGLHPLNVTVVGVTLLKNSEHESSFSLRLGEAKLRTTERLLVVGEHHRLMGYAANGVSQQPQLESTLPACVFYRKPFHNLHRPTSVAVLVCDVVIGKPFIGASSATSAEAAQLTTPKEGSPAFLREFDSCVFLDPVAGQSVAVYQPQQVLPKYLVQCNVDTTITPCPAHPSKAVEFFVVESNVFACSQCVVMGQYRGKEVITVEDATLQARSQLQDIQRDILHVVSEMAAAEADCDRQVQTLQQSEVRMSANRQIELIRREAEQKIAAIQQDLESYERQRKDAVLDARSQAKRVMDDAQGVAKQLDDGLRFRGPNEVISLLINTKRAGLVDSIKDRANAVRHGGTGDTGIALPGTLSGAGNGQQPQAQTSFRSASAQLPANQRSASAVGSASAAASFHPGILQQQSTNVSFAAADESISGLNRTPRTGAPVGNTTTPGAPPLDTNALYNKFLSLKHQSSSGITGNVAPLSATGASFGQPASATRAAVRATADLEAKRMKDLITSGWAEFRKGDKHAAQRIWQDVFERNQQNATGARAKAYIAEAIEKNYASAGQWYEKALSFDPQDCLTLYNYGVLLESVMDRKRDALQLFETAHRLGDQTAGKRATQLRQSLQQQAP